MQLLLDLQLALGHVTPVFRQKFRPGLAELAPLLRVGINQRIIVGEGNAGLVHLLQRLDEHVLLLALDELVGHESLDERRLPEKLRHDRVVRVQLGGLLRQHLRLFVFLLVHIFVAVVHQQGHLFLNLDLQPLLPLHVLLNSLVLLGQLDLRAVSVDHLLGFGDGAIDVAQHGIARRRVEARRFHLLPRLFQEGQRRLGIALAERVGGRFLVGQFGGDLSHEQLLPGNRVVGQR